MLKRMMNAVAADVMLGRYVAKSDAQLRAGWQTVADWIEAEAQRCAARSQVPPGSVASIAAPRAQPLDGVYAGGDLDDWSHGLRRPSLFDEEPWPASLLSPSGCR